MNVALDALNAHLDEHLGGVFVDLQCVAFDLLVVFFFFFNDTATTEIYTLSLHDALPIFPSGPNAILPPLWCRPFGIPRKDRKSTRLNSSHRCISYAVFCLKKKKTNP